MSFIKEAISAFREVIKEWRERLRLSIRMEIAQTFNASCNRSCSTSSEQVVDSFSRSSIHHFHTRVIRSITKRTSSRRSRIISSRVLLESAERESDCL